MACTSRTPVATVGIAVLLALGFVFWRGFDNDRPRIAEPLATSEDPDRIVSATNLAEMESGDVRAAIARTGEGRVGSKTPPAGGRPRIRGRVVQDRVGVPGAEVYPERDLRGMGGLDLERRSPHPFEARIERGAVTDKDGAFELEGLARGGWFLRARGPDGASGRAQPPASLLEGQDAEVVIELDTKPGRVLGTLVVPAGERPDDYFLDVAGAKLRFSERVPASGQFVWDSHPAGHWTVEVRRMQEMFNDVEPGARFSDGVGHGFHRVGDAPQWAASDVEAFPFAVHPGGTTDLVIDPRDTDFNRLRGQLEVRRGEGEAGPWVASVYLMPADDRSGRRFGSAREEPDGNYELLTRADGELLVAANFKFTPDWTGTWKGSVRVLDRVDLKAGKNNWSFRLELGRLRVFLPKGVARTQVELLHRHEGGARIYASGVPVEEGEPGEVLFPNAPAGPCELFVESAGVRRVLASLDVLQNPGVDEMKLDLRRGTDQK